MKLLHIIPDENFWRIIITIFNKVNVQNEYVCVVSDDERKTQYVDSDFVRVVAKCEAGSLWDRNDIDGYIFHSLPYEYYDYVLSIQDKRKKVIVSFWGFDIYYSQGGCTPILPLSLYKPKTQRLMNAFDKPNSSFIYVKRFIKSVLYFRRDRRRKATYQQIIDKRTKKQAIALERIDYVATVLPNEFEMLLSTNKFRALYFPLVYSLVGEQPIIDPNISKDILIGNSADPSNNHLDIFRIIKDRDITNKLFIPIAYGESAYALALREEIKSTFTRYEFQDRMLPFDEYSSKLMNCRAAVFGHIRQQAAGNIGICLLQGKKVFLYKDSIAYKYYKSQGSFVYSIEEDLSQKEVDIPLTREQIEFNIEVVQRSCMEEVVSRLNQSFETMKVGN